MNFLNADFHDSKDGRSAVDEFREFYLSMVPSHRSHSTIHNMDSRFDMSSQDVEHGKAGVIATLAYNTLVLSERTMLNYVRNLLAYGVRLGMYAGR
jgi:hypothetical protein